MLWRYEMRGNNAQSRRLSAYLFRRCCVKYQPVEYAAYINVLKESELAVFDFKLGGKSLLDRAIEAARSAPPVRRVVLRTRNKAVGKLAQTLGIEVDDGALGGTREPHFLVSLHYPFKSGEHFQQLADAGAATAVCITAHRHHPVGAFVANKGRMDFSATLDSPVWRNIDERRYFQPVDSLSLHFGPGPAKRACFVVDEMSALGVFDESDRELAELIVARELAKGGAPWAKL